VKVWTWTELFVVAAIVVALGAMSTVSILLLR
jgi:hypothetical protein